MASTSASIFSFPYSFFLLIGFVVYRYCRFIIDRLFYVVKCVSFLKTSWVSASLLSIGVPVNPIKH
jgi:hypothetical protein